MHYANTRHFTHTPYGVFVSEYAEIEGNASLYLIESHIDGKRHETTLQGETARHVQHALEAERAQRRPSHG